MTAQTSTADRPFFDLSPRVKLRVVGADRSRFLNGQITNDIRKANAKVAIEACVLNAKGKMDAHLFVHLDGDSFLIDADPLQAPTLQARLERYVIADDVQIEDVTAQISIFHLIGPDVPTLSVPNQVVAVDRFGVPGADISCDASSHDMIASELKKERKLCEPDCAERLRIERGIPRWGRELTAEIIPVEANLELRCIDYDKGCYIGQETISRMKMSGQRNKQLCGLVSLTGATFVPEMRLVAGPENKDAGWITSITRSGDREIALGYVKRGFNSVGTKLEAVSGHNGRVTTEVVGLPFSH
ncbi:MAG TPA: glycine cleavage T C-terminal barrel domain-containing protein [Chthoniobacterales bacterium]|nr:glycine cleavage T C-terminal barrel domain-containing protein [Chthoniobacterales bacterium]